jgi:hypothetical protein
MEGVIDLIDKLLYSMVTFISKFLKSTKGQTQDSLPLDIIRRILIRLLIILIITSIFMPCIAPFLVIPIIITIVLIIYLKRKI